VKSMYFSASPPLRVMDWGLTSYGDALVRQRELLEDRKLEDTPDCLVLVEHPPVITVGRSGSDGDLRVSKGRLLRKGIEVFHVDRGGKATYHGPGQLVAYPVMKLPNKDLHLYIERLLEAAARVLGDYGIEAARDERQPGLWVEGAKIASIGIAVQKWVTYHGLALNVNTDLEGFDFIVPCGLPGQPVTSMQQALGRRLEMEAVKQRFIARFAECFGYRIPCSANLSSHVEKLI